MTESRYSGEGLSSRRKKNQIILFKESLVQRSKIFKEEDFDKFLKFLDENSIQKTYSYAVEARFCWANLKKEDL